MSELNVDKERARIEIKDWIDTIMRRKGLNGSTLAKMAGVAPSTILRMFSDQNYTFVPTFSTITKISGATGYKVPPSILEAFGVTDDGLPSGVERKHIPDEVVRERVLEGVGVMDPGHLANPPMYRSLGKVKNRPAEPAPPSRGDVEPQQGRPLRRKGAERMRIRYLSNLPKAIQPPTRSEVFVDCPPRLEGDQTAFAFYLNDTSLAPLMPSGSLMYATKTRDPIKGDVVMLTKSDGRSIVRFVTDISETGISVSKSSDAVTDVTIPFDDIADVGVVVLMERT